MSMKKKLMSTAVCALMAGSMLFNAGCSNDNKKNSYDKAMDEAYNLGFFTLESTKTACIKFVKKLNKISLGEIKVEDRFSYLGEALKGYNNEEDVFDVLNETELFQNVMFIMASEMKQEEGVKRLNFSKDKNRRTVELSAKEGVIITDRDGNQFIIDSNAERKELTAEDRRNMILEKAKKIRAKQALKLEEPKTP